MLTASEIARALEASLKAGHSLAIVSLMARDGRIDEHTARLLVAGDGALISGSLGDSVLDAAAARQAVALLADDRREIVVADANELTASSSGEIDLQAFGQVRLLFEISRPPLELIVCGGGHVGQAVAIAGRFLDFNVTVIDDRSDFASREKFPDERIRLIADDFVAALRSLRITPATHIVIVTRGHRHDEICLQEVIGSPARYIGMIGSRRRTTTIRERLKREGVAPELLRQVHAPIGLDINALTPEEIALAILAEIVLVRRGGSGAPKSADGPMARAR